MLTHELKITWCSNTDVLPLTADAFYGSEVEKAFFDLVWGILDYQCEKSNFGISLTKKSELM